VVAPRWRAPRRPPATVTVTPSAVRKLAGRSSPQLVAGAGLDHLDRRGSQPVDADGAGPYRGGGGDRSSSVSPRAVGRGSVDADGRVVRSPSQRAGLTERTPCGPSGRGSPPARSSIGVRRRAPGCRRGRPPVRRPAGSAVASPSAGGGETTTSSCSRVQVAFDAVGLRCCPGRNRCVTDRRAGQSETFRNDQSCPIRVGSFKTARISWRKVTIDGGPACRSHARPSQRAQRPHVVRERPAPVSDRTLGYRADRRPARCAPAAPADRRTDRADPGTASTARCSTGSCTASPRPPAPPAPVMLYTATDDEQEMRPTTLLGVRTRRLRTHRHRHGDPVPPGSRSAAPS
jgi:hypothetical protein